MTKNFFCLVTIAFALSIPAFAQGTVEQRGEYQPSAEQMAAYKRLLDLLRHPTFVTLRLVTVDNSSHETSTPTPFEVGDRMSFQLLITQSLPEALDILRTVSPYYEYRPELVRDGAILPYTEEAQQSVEEANRTPFSGSMSSARLIPGREAIWDRVTLDRWYERLGVGHYQLTVRKRFVHDGDWAESNPITFDIVPRRVATPLPQALKVRLLPDGLEPLPEGQAFRLGNDINIRVFVVNDSDQRVRVSVIDELYGNRLQLFKDGKLVPYRDDTAKLIQSKDETPGLVERAPDFFLEPKTSLGLQQIYLKDWYGTLAPGSYRLIDRRRLEIDGPWTANSAELLFVIPQP